MCGEHHHDHDGYTESTDTNTGDDDAARDLTQSTDSVSTGDALRDERRGHPRSRRPSDRPAHPRSSRRP